MANKIINNNSLRSLDILAKLLDSQFRIPGTKIRFGLDGIIGLIPGAGDFATFLVSGYMILILAKKGASNLVLAKMTFNIIADALIGSIPILGDLFDVVFKANQRNMKLMHEHYQMGKHQGSALKIIIPLLLILLLIITLIAWGSYKLFMWLYHWAI